MGTRIKSVYVLGDYKVRFVVINFFWTFETLMSNWQKPALKILITAGTPFVWSIMKNSIAHQSFAITRTSRTTMTCIKIMTNTRKITLVFYYWIHWAGAKLPIVSWGLMVPCWPQSTSCDNDFCDQVVQISRFVAIPSYL